MHYITNLLASIVIVMAFMFGGSSCLYAQDYEKVKEEETPKTDNKETDEEEIFQVVEEMPEFPGGMEKLLEYLGKNIKYPSIAMAQGIQGRVLIEFVVNKDGSIVEPKAIRSLHPKCDEEAIRVIKTMPKWKPGKQKGKPVRVKFTVPVTFLLLEEETPKADNKETDEEEIFQVVEEKPEFPGGIEKLLVYLAQNIKYPTVVMEQGIQGRVLIEFVVNKDGSIVEPKVTRSLHPKCDEEAIRVIKAMPKWKPGKQKGKPVRVKYTVPVNFLLS